jgi:phosphohistidine phosphatase SixA
MRWIVSLLVAFAASAAAQPDASLAERLREGGYVLFLRHTSTDFSQNDAKMSSFEDCGNQRNLTDKGRAEARMIGEHVQRLRIPIARVLASPFCRTMETARLAFGSAEPMQEVRGGPARTDDPKRYDALRQLLSTSPPPGKNVVISSHGNPFYALAGPPYLAEGEIAVVHPEGDGKFSVIAKIRLEDWALLR